MAKIPRDRILEDPYSQSPGKALVLLIGLIKWLVILGLSGLLVLAINNQVQAQSDYSEGVTTGVLAATTPGESKSGRLLFRSPSNLYTQALHLRSEADIDINGLLAKVSLKQVFRNDTDQWVEGVYVFPLSEKAAVNHIGNAYWFEGSHWRNKRAK